MNESGATTPSPDKREQLEALRRWFYDDWHRIEPKLRTSIVEGISVFLSLFDDNPVVARAFCPPKSAYTAAPKPGQKHGTSLPPLDQLPRLPFSNPDPAFNKPYFDFINQAFKK